MFLANGVPFIQPNSSLIKPFEPSSKKFILVTSLYNEPKPERAREYLTCLEKNLNHSRIAHIHVVYEFVPGDNSELLNYLLSKNISIEFVSSRPSYGFMFDLVNRQYPGQKIIVSNADIYFNETLTLLDDYDLTNKFLALTRWNVRADGSMTPYFTVKKMYSQDTWIFRAPLKKFNDDSMVLGTCGCDNRLAFQADAAGLEVLNPCGSIQCCHLHLSNVRNYKKCKPMDPAKDLFKGLDWGFI
jgi:hypothetical protein